MRVGFRANISGRGVYSRLLSQKSLRKHVCVTTQLLSSVSERWNVPIPPKTLHCMRRKLRHLQPPNNGDNFICDTVSNNLLFSGLSFSSRIWDKQRTLPAPKGEIRLVMFWPTFWAKVWPMPLLRNPSVRSEKPSITVRIQRVTTWVFWVLWIFECREEKGMKAEFRSLNEP